MADENALFPQRLKEILRTDTNFSVTMQIIHANKNLSADVSKDFSHANPSFLFQHAAKASTNQNCFAEQQLFDYSDKVSAASWSILACCCSVFSRQGSTFTQVSQTALQAC